MRHTAALVAGAVAAVAIAAVAAPGAGAQAGTAQDALARLNLQRAASGIPAGLTEDPTLSSDCAQHDDYMAINHILTHYEQPSAPGYTTGGAFAGTHAVLAKGTGWAAGNPYENAPLHLDLLLAPRLSTLGSADAEGYSCTTTYPGWTRPDPPALTVYTYPGNGAKIYPSEVARESPWTPADLAGIPPQTRTGPNLIVLVDAPGQQPSDNPAALSGATLTGPTGALTVMTVDGMTPLPNGQPTPTLAPYISPGGFIIPVRPLLAGMTYHAHVLVTFAGVTTPHDWSFTTLGADPSSSLTARGATLAFKSRSPQPIRITFTRAGGQHAPSVTIRPGHSVRVKLVPGSWQACGHEPGTDTLAGYDHCLAIIVTGTPALRFGTPRVHGSKVLFPLAFSPVLHGRKAALTVTPLTVVCGASGCATTAGRASTSIIVLRSQSFDLPLPAHGHGLLVAIATSAFQLADAPWTAARAATRFVSH